MYMEVLASLSLLNYYDTFIPSFSSVSASLFFICFFFFFSSRRRHTRSLCDWSSDVCSSDLLCLRAPASRRSSPRAWGRARPQARGEDRRDAGARRQRVAETARRHSDRDLRRSEERRVGKEGRSRGSPYH